MFAFLKSFFAEAPAESSIDMVPFAERGVLAFERNKTRLEFLQESYQSEGECISDYVMDPVPGDLNSDEMITFLEEELSSRSMDVSSISSKKAWYNCCCCGFGTADN